MLDKYPLLHNICLYLCTQMRILVVCQHFFSLLCSTQAFVSLFEDESQQSDKVAIISLDLYYSGEQ